ncbi:MAG TPA: MraY family glycosyltransferase [Patescibacteria group bacterium]|nr:MraY family glycosyltransferase [Patescibacteria group bacterium]
MYFIFFIISFFLALVLTPILRKIALKLSIIDFPFKKRKIHKKPTPLLGGLAIFLVIFIVVFLAFLLKVWPEANVNLKHLLGLLLGGAILMIGGFLDDKYDLSPWVQIIWPILAALVVIVSGVGIEFINNPFGEGYIYFNNLKIEVLKINGIPYYFTPWSDIITFIWLMILMYATKLLDGLDGLVSGLTCIGALTIAGLCLLTIFHLPNLGFLSLIVAGAFLGFLIYNFQPAKIFLGEGGSLFAGFILGCLAILSGSKLATTFLIAGLAIFDIFGVFFKRILKGKSPFKGDKSHLHFRLLRLGMSKKKAVIIYWILALIFGFSALFLQTIGKVIAIILLFVIFIILGIFLPIKTKDSGND